MLQEQHLPENLNQDMEKQEEIQLLQNKPISSKLSDDAKKNISFVTLGIVAIPSLFFISPFSALGVGSLISFVVHSLIE